MSIYILFIFYLSQMQKYFNSNKFFYINSKSMILLLNCLEISNINIKNKIKNSKSSIYFIQS